MARSHFIPVWLRRRVVRRARNRCEYCRVPQVLCSDPLQLDHVLPQAMSGPTEFKNLALACSVCNNAKRAHTTAKDPDTGRRVRLFSPRAQGWDEHFRWSEDFGTILGLTPVGRATIIRLRMNRPRIVRLRRLWVKLGMHPPE
jgi:hypothetical protein